LYGDHPLFDSLSRLTSLTSLNLGGNTFANEFIDRLIGDILPNAKSLASLNLRSTGALSSESIRKLVPCLKQLAELTYLGVGAHFLDDESKAALRKLKEANPGLKIMTGTPGNDRPINLYR
jgi:Ran GTPase-activating protein (RanGAP) involved in mRNA processing and transport